MLGGVVEPAVVVGDDAHGGVRHLRFAREEDLGHVGHADQVAARLAQEAALGLRAEPGPFDAGIGRGRGAAACPRVRPPPGAASTSAALTGLAVDTCAATPPPKNVRSRLPRVQSKYCSGTARSPGAISSARLPTAEKPSSIVAPARLSAKTLAR